MDGISSMPTSVTLVLNIMGTSNLVEFGGIASVDAKRQLGERFAMVKVNLKEKMHMFLLTILVYDFKVAPK